jgi:Cu(I)/Ag(I) efflux system membrane protein CusA/SilA
MDARPSALDRLLRFCLENKLVVGLLVLFALAWGAMTAPFRAFDGLGLPRDPVPVDAIPDTGENQQIVFTEWAGRSPQDVDDQITYPLTVALLGVPGVRSIRSTSMFGFSSVFVIFDDGIEFYWSRSRILEKLQSLPANTLPDGVEPALGPDATALGQVYWYTLEGRDAEGRPTGGWDLQELRSVQDWYVRYALQSVPGVAEVASIGGYVKEYQVDVDPDAMRHYGVTLDRVFRAIQASNVDVGARTIEVNRAEYLVRGLGFLDGVEDIEQTVVAVHEGVPVTIAEVAQVAVGPALRRGALDRGGAEAVGGVVVVRYGANPMEVIDGIHQKVAEIAPGLSRKTLDDGNVSQVAIVPFYDRTELIEETLDTLSTALRQQILVTILVVLVMVAHFRSALLISSLLPLGVLGTFVAMRYFGVDANVVALSGIAIAIGTMVDMGIVLTENVLKHVREDDGPRERLEAVYRASSEVGSAVLTAVLTTVVSFLPVFTMEGQEGKLFKPLAFTKTFALLASVVVALVVIPPFAHLLLARPRRAARRAQIGLLTVAAALLGYFVAWWAAAIALAVAVLRLAWGRLSERARSLTSRVASLLAAVAIALLLAFDWAPIGPGQDLANVVFTVGVVGGLLALFWLFQAGYEPLLRLCLAAKWAFLALPLGMVVFGLAVWLGFDRVAELAFSAGVAILLMVTGPAIVAGFRALGAGGWPQVLGGVLALLGLVGGIAAWWGVALPLGQERFGRTAFHVAARHALPGLGKQFMPPLDEGSFLLMPVTSYHASIGEAIDVLQKQDMAIRAIPEVRDVVGKVGRVESPLDPAPLGMIETVVTYLPEYRIGPDGEPERFRYDAAAEAFVLDGEHQLIPDPAGRLFRNWRPSIQGPDDIWNEVERAARLVGTTHASKQGPIETRRVMLQTGMRNPLGVKVRGPDLATVERVAVEIQELLKEVPTVSADTVIADRIVGKPYLEIDIDRAAIARYGLMIRQVQDVIEVAVGGRRITTTVEGRERYPVRVRYLRELRDQIETLGRILVAAPDGTQVPLEQLAEIRYIRGPQAIKSEDTFLVAYVLLDKKPGRAEVDVVEDCQRFLQEKLDSGEFVLPAGVSYRFSGSYENQIRAQKTLSIVLPLALFLIFLILYFQFKQVPTTLLVFSGIIVAWAGGFLMIWAYGQDWFLDFAVFGVNMRDLFQVHTINLSVAIWVGFLALFGIASDDGVVIATYLDQSFGAARIETIEDARAATLEAGLRRVRPCLMTTATTILALIPVLTSNGKGSDIMVPMAIPSFGGMLIEVMTMLVVPVVYCAIKEFKIKAGIHDELFKEGAR